jgi:hypothetical protein
VHPIERLRYVARAGGSVDQLVLVRETAGALASLGFDPAGLVTSCRRVLARHSTAGALWCLAARVLSAADPMHEAWRFCDELADDGTARKLSASLPEEATVMVVGWPDVVATALPRRGDLEVLVVDAYGEGAGLVRQLLSRDVEAVEVPVAGLGAAAAESDVVVVEAALAGPAAVIAPAGSRAAAAVARSAGRHTWLVVPAGRALPASLFDAACRPLAVDEPWESDEEIVPADLFDALVGPDGMRPADHLRLRVDCPVVPELLKL